MEEITNKLPSGSSHFKRDQRGNKRDDDQRNTVISAVDIQHLEQCSLTHNYYQC